MKVRMTMKNIASLLVAMIVSAYAVMASASAAPMAPRPVTINFQATLVDADALAYDGSVDAAAYFYRAPGSNPVDLVYAETFDATVVRRGVLQLALFGGVPDGGTAFSAAALAQEPELYVDITIDGTTFLASHPLGAQFAAIRAEYAAVAEGLRSEIKLAKEEVPQHSAQLITTGVLSPEQIGGFDAARVTSGIFGYDKMPNLDAGKVTKDGTEGATFPETAMPNDFAATQFTQGTLSDAVITDEILRTDDIAVDFGLVGHNGYLGVPAGFDRSQCQWILSLRHLDGGGGVDQFHISWQQTGEVECRWSPREDGMDEQFCTANYLMVCKK